MWHPHFLAIALNYEVNRKLETTFVEHFAVKPKFFVSLTFSIYFLGAIQYSGLPDSLTQGNPQHITQTAHETKSNSFLMEHEAGE